MKKTVFRFFCGLLAAMLTAGVSMASDIRVASSVYTVNSVASAVNAMRDQLDDMTVNGELDTAKGAGITTQCAEFVIYCSASKEITDDQLNERNGTLIIDAAAVSDLARQAWETRESVLEEIAARNARTLCDLPVAVKFVTPKNISIELRPDILRAEIPVDLIVVETSLYQLEIRLSEIQDSLYEPLTIALRDVGESDVKIQVELSNENLAGYMRLSLGDEAGVLFAAELPDGKNELNHYVYNPVTRKTEGSFHSSGVYYTPERGNFFDQFLDLLNGSISAAMRIAIEELRGQNIIDGQWDENSGSYVFNPDDGVTRRAFVKILMNAIQDVDPKLKPTYKDVFATDFYYHQAATAQRRGYMNGYSADIFQGNEPLIRQQICAILERVLRGNRCTLSVNTAEQLRGYKDRDAIGSYSRDAVALLTYMGIVAPDANGNFDPYHNMTRGEVAEMIYNMLESYPYF